MKWFSGAVIGFVVIAALGAFILVGSPQKEREKKIDSIRMSHLSMLQYEIAEYWRVHKALPATLAELRPNGTINLPVDPESGQLYEYRTLTSTSFEVCATFSVESEPMQSAYAEPLYPSYGQFIQNPEQWNHTLGRSCFTRQINETYYINTALPDPVKVVPAVQ